MLPDHCHRRIDIDSTAALYRSTETAALLASGVLSEAGAARLDEIVGRLAHRLAGYAAGGILLLRRFGRRDGVECLALDRGPGHRNIDAALADEALRAVRLLADEFSLHTAPDCGTAILARVAGSPSRTQIDPAVSLGRGVVEGGAVMTARPGAEGCSDGWFLRPDGLAALICGSDDGGGSRSSAALARRIETVVSATVSGIPAPMVIAAVRQSCGAGLVANVAALRLTGSTVDYTALGSIPGAVVRDSGLTSLSARWAMIGYNPHVPGCVHLDWRPGDHVVLSSEGCGRLPGLFIKRQLHKVDPTLAAAVLMRDGEVPPGDHTVMVLRNIGGD